VSNVKKEGKVITISFQNAEGGLVLEGKTINALKIQSNGTPLSFRVELSENALILRLNEDAAAPIKVEFAQERFYLVNLYNKAHIPALPFSLTLEEEQYAD
jgi:sialate O-acetylesterase